MIKFNSKINLFSIDTLAGIGAVKKPSEGCIHHSDRGVQYAAREYVDDLKAAGFRNSMARKGNPYDNAQAESFIKNVEE